MTWQILRTDSFLCIGFIECPWWYIKTFSSRSIVISQKGSVHTVVIFHTDPCLTIATSDLDRVGSLVNVAATQGNMGDTIADFGMRLAVHEREI